MLCRCSSYHETFGNHSQFAVHSKNDQSYLVLMFHVLRVLRFLWHSERYHDEFSIEKRMKRSFIIILCDIMQQRISLELGTCGGIFGIPVGFGCVRRTASGIVNTATKYWATKVKSPRIKLRFLMTRKQFIDWIQHIGLVLKANTDQKPRHSISNLIVPEYFSVILIVI